MNRALITLIAIGVVALASAAQADPLDDQILKFRQDPMIATPINGQVYFGHDELSTALLNAANNSYQGDSWMADDFADHFDAPVVHVEWWGSYLTEFPFKADKFLIEFLADNPADPDTGRPSRPQGPPLLSQVVRLGLLTPGSGTFTETLVPGSNPSEPVYHYNAELRVPFQQKAETVYWLKIVALVNDPGIVWGWHNRDYTIMDPLASVSPQVVPGEHMAGVIPPVAAGDPATPIWHFQDDAVRGSVIFVQLDAADNVLTISEDWDASVPQNYVNLVDGPGTFVGLDGTDFPGINAFSKDLAFRLYTVPEPMTIVLLAVGGLGLAARSRRRVR